MNKEAQRIAIAEACGWKPLFISCDLNGNPFPGQDVPPDYLNDLNAMHEAEKVLTIEQQRHYAEELGRSYDGSFLHVTASADQRAKALLKALNLWKNA